MTALGDSESRRRDISRRVAASTIRRELREAMCVVVGGARAARRRRFRHAVPTHPR